MGFDDIFSVLIQFSNPDRKLTCVFNASKGTLWMKRKWLMWQLVNASTWTWTFNSSQKKTLWQSFLWNEPPAPKATCPLVLPWLSVWLLKEELEAQIPARTVISRRITLWETHGIKKKNKPSWGDSFRFAYGRASKIVQCFCKSFPQFPLELKPYNNYSTFIKTKKTSSVQYY